MVCTEPENMACTWFGEICSCALNNSKFEELVNAAGLAKTYTPEVQRCKFEYLHLELEKMRKRWHDMVVMALDIKRVLVKGCGDTCAEEAEELKLEG